MAAGFLSLLSAARAMSAASAPVPNVARDGEYLVAPLWNAVFPARCVQTNQSVPAADFEFQTDLMPNQVSTTGMTSMAGAAAEGFLHGLTGTNVGGVLRGIDNLVGTQRLSYRIGLSQEAQDRYNFRWQYGIGLCIAGPIFGVAGMIAVGWLLNSVLKISIDIVGPIMIAAMGLGMAGLLAGVILFALSKIAVLSVVRSDGNLVWFSGADRRFLASLPLSPVKFTPPSLW
jgi:hypothetical protein